MTDPDQTFAVALAGLSLPRPSALSAGYAAGLAAGRRQVRAWRLATVAIAGLAVAGVLRPGPTRPANPERPRPAPLIAMVPPPDPVSLLALSRLPMDVSPRGFQGGPREQPTAGAWMTEPPPVLR